MLLSVYLACAAVWADSSRGRVRQVITNVKEAIEDDVDNLDGYDEVSEEVRGVLLRAIVLPPLTRLTPQNQAKIRKTLEQGHVDDADSQLSCVPRSGLAADGSTLSTFKSRTRRGNRPQRKEKEKKKTQKGTKSKRRR